MNPATYSNLKFTTISVDLPADIVAILTAASDGYTSWDADISPINTSSGFNIDLYLATQSSDGILSRLEYAMISGSASESINLIP